MEDYLVGISNTYNCLFANEDDKRFAAELIEHLLLGTKPVTTPGLWQDAEIYVRYKKRDVWHLEKEQFDNAEKAIGVFSMKYILEHMKKNEILDVMKQFFSQDRHGKDNLSLMECFQKKLSAPVADLFLTQEKVTVNCEMLKNFDRLFDYPTWIEFDDAATKKCFQMVMHDKMTDEQISYFFGAHDDMKQYDKWFEAAKHVLMTTNNPQTFWIAGDVLNIVWMALPDDEALQKWFRDQVFEIFWPRVGSVWPMINRERIDFDASDDLKITADAMGWLGSLKDLHERLPELPENYELNLSEGDDKAFQEKVRDVLEQNDGDKVRYVGITNNFYALCDMACTEKHLEDLEYVKKELVKEFQIWSNNSEEFSHDLDAAIRHAKKYVADMKREGEVMRKYISERI